jgi:hypothetical protein
VRRASERPPVVIIARDGDPRGAIAVAVSTAGIAAERGAEAAVALAAVVEARVEAKGISVRPAWDGFLVRVLVADEREAGAMAVGIREALSAPLASPETARVEKKLAALAQRPLRDPALLDAARCTGEPFGISSAPAAGLPEVEAWRKAAHTLGRVAFAAVGPAAIGEAVAEAIARGPAWARGAAGPTEAEHEPSQGVSGPPLAVGQAGPGATDRGGALVYDASADLTGGGARATITVHTPRAPQAVAAAPRLADARGPLASRLGALDAPARVRDVSATAHSRGGCIAVTIDMTARDLGGASDAPARIATAVALARQEIAVEVEESEGLSGTEVGAVGRATARRAGDPREAAERAVWWELALDRGGGVRIGTAIGIAGGRDDASAAKSGAVPAATAAAAAIRTEIDRATVAWSAPVVEARTRVERGQGEVWVLLASPCGSLSEGDADAGLGAAIALASARHGEATPAEDGRVELEGWVTSEGIGVIAHAPPLTGESSGAHARRVADAAARRFAADPVDLASVARVRAQLLRASEQADVRALGALAGAVAPGHSAWLAPLGSLDSLARSSDASALARASALRSGPLRVAAIANVDSAQADAAARATDRWVARRPGEARSCPLSGAAAPPRPGTYALDITSQATGASALPPGSSAEAWLGLALPPNDVGARDSAVAIAAMLDGESGLLARALGGGLARAWSAKVIGPSRAPALVVRIATAQGALDAAVAQTRALLDRLRQGALAEADRARAMEGQKKAELLSSLEPRTRVIQTWTGAPPSSEPPTLESLRAFAASTLRDDALIIVAARPRSRT